MFSLCRPSAAAIDRFLTEQSRLPFSYGEVGATGGSPPAGFNADHYRFRLGSGEAVFSAAVQALERWWMFDMGWVELPAPPRSITPGTTVGLLVRPFRLWTLMACRIVYVVRETGELHRNGFAYGTLAGHMEQGEERFLIEWDTGDDSVWYDVRAFSRPNAWMAWLGYPLTRRLQRRFVHDSAAALKRALTRILGAAEVCSPGLRTCEHLLPVEQVPNREMPR